MTEVVRNFDEEMKYIHKTKVPNEWIIEKGFVPNMNVPCKFYANDDLKELIFNELNKFIESDGHGTFLPAVKQVANVSSLPGIIDSIAMPDEHAGYGFCIGNVAAFDMSNPESVVSPGGIGFDINCGVRLIRTNLNYKDIVDLQEDLAEDLFQTVPGGIGSRGSVKLDMKELDKVLTNGIDWCISNGYACEEDKVYCEENGVLKNNDCKLVSNHAKKRGLQQIGTLGAGNHYLDVLRITDIYDKEAANTMGIFNKDQICVMLHTGSRGLGHQICTDYLKVMEEAMYKDKRQLNDKQLACARINSKEGQDYLKAMACGANYAWANRSVLTHLARQSFERIFKTSAEELDMNVIYDVSHNMAKVENHTINGKNKKLLVHRKGSTRAFAPNHPQIPQYYQKIGQPVLIGGSMSTPSYVLTGTDKSMSLAYGSTCHGAGRSLSRTKAKKVLNYNQVWNDLNKKGITLKVRSKNLVKEEAGDAYKNVNDVVNTCHNSGLSKKCIKMMNCIVLKG